jgi:FdhE protein
MIRLAKILIACCAMRGSTNRPRKWRCQRIGCPFCGNEDPYTWTYYPSDDKVYRLYVCDACQGYLKTVDQREQAEPLMLATERILTASMDAAAADAGYRASP